MHSFHDENDTCEWKHDIARIATDITSSRVNQNYSRIPLYNDKFLQLKAGLVDPE